MRAERSPGSLSGLSDDQLGTIAVSLVVSELQWTPDVAPSVMDRISRDAVAYPEQFDRRPIASASATPRLSPRPSLMRSIGRLAVLLVIVLLVAALVLVAATAQATALGVDWVCSGGLAAVLITEVP